MTHVKSFEKSSLYTHKSVLLLKSADKKRKQYNKRACLFQTDRVHQLRFRNKAVNVLANKKDLEGTDPHH